MFGKGRMYCTSQKRGSKGLRGWQMPDPYRQRKIWLCPTTGTDKVGKCPTVAPEGEERGGMWHLEWLLHMERYLIFYSEPFPHPQKTVPNPSFFVNY